MKKPPAASPVSVMLGGEQWIVRRARLRGKWGVANFSDKEIVIDPSCEKEHKTREIFLHECLHALAPYLDEEVVAAAAVDLDNALEAMDL